jgi:hypothetical protein
VDRHDLDPLALVFGATFIVLGAAYALTRWSWLSLDQGWLIGAFLIVLGGAGIVSAAGRRSRTDP